MRRFNLHGFLSYSLCGIQVSALIEIGAFFAGALIIDAALGEGVRFTGLVLHPFWIILLLITVQYGAKEALLCALVASVCLLVNNIPTQQIVETRYDYLFRILHLPILWVATATILGAIRSRHIREREMLEKTLKRAEERSETITGAYQQLRAVKERLELRLAEELRSLVVVYEAAKTLETIDQRKLLKAVKNIVRTTLNPAKFSFYIFRSTGFELVACQGWDKQEEYTLIFSPNSRLYQEMTCKQRVICVVNEADEAILKDQGIMACPIIDGHNGEMIGMLKIEEMGVMGTSIRNMEIFKIVCEWVGMAYANTRKYQAAVSANIVGSNRNDPINDPVNEVRYETRAAAYK